MDDRGIEDRVRAALRRASDAVPPPSRGGAEKVVRRARRRAVLNVVVASLTSGALVFGAVLGVAALIPSERDVPTAVGEPVEVSATSRDGRLRCSASLPSNVLEPGDIVDPKVSLQNVSAEPVSVLPHGKSFEVTNADGRTLWRVDPLPQQYTTSEYSTFGRTLRGGETIAIDGPGTGRAPVLWPGLLALEGLNCTALVVGAETVTLHLPPVRLFVAASGSGPTRSEALVRVLTQTHGLFDECLPQEDGSWTTGRLELPAGVDLPSLDVRCSAAVRAYESFAVVFLRIVGPASAPEVAFPADAPFNIWDDFLPGDGTMQMLQWTFVVTGREVRDVMGIGGKMRWVSQNAKGWGPLVGLVDGQWKLLSPITDVCGNAMGENIMEEGSPSFRWWTPPTWCSSHS